MKKQIILTTTDTIPNKKYEIIGLVMGNHLTWFSSKGASSSALARLEAEAIEWVQMQ